jgi:DNA processing protein
MDRERYVLALMHLPGVARRTAWKAVHAIPEVPESAEELLAAVTKVKDIKNTFTRSDATEAWSAAGRLLERAEVLHIGVMAAIHPDFPCWVRNIPDPPLVLYFRGCPELARDPFGIAVVGTREPTDYGNQVAHRFGQRAAEAGCVVISGLAVGCDAAGHRGCLDAKGRAVAVLAHGLDRVYPKSNEPLAQEILDNRGCWVSEYPPGERAHRGYFVERDRLQSALSCGLIIVETDTVGGTMHTARFATDQGRLIACLSHPPKEASAAKARGNRQLIDERRATPLATAEDLQGFLQRVRECATQRTNGSEAAPVPTILQEPGGLFEGVDDGSGGSF